MTNRKSCVLFKEPILGPLKSKMADIRHLEYRYLAIANSPLPDFSEFLGEEAVFQQNSAMARIANTRVSQNVQTYAPSCLRYLMQVGLRWAFRIVSDMLRWLPGSYMYSIALATSTTSSCMIDCTLNPFQAAHVG